MAYSKSKTKGSSYELKIAKQLTAWWGYEFHRTPNSGAWSSTHGSDMQAGDIITPIEAKFPFTIECKNHEGWTLEHVMTNKGNHSDWWNQCIIDAFRVKKVPMLIFHRNRSESFTTIPYSAIIESQLRNNNKVAIKHEVVFYNKVLDVTQKYIVLTTILEHFTETFEPDNIKKYHKNMFKDWGEQQGDSEQ